VDVQGIDNHQLVDIPLVTAGAIVRTQQGDMIAIMYQYAYMGKGKTICSSGQLKWFCQQVDDKPIQVGGQQRITTHEGYVIPLNIRSGLPYVSIRPCTDMEWEELPHVILTSPKVWSPSLLNHDLDDGEEWFDAIWSLPDEITESLFDEYGDYRHKHIVNQHMIDAPDLENHVIPTKDFFYEEPMTQKFVKPVPLHAPLNQRHLTTLCINQTFAGYLLTQSSVNSTLLRNTHAFQW
jgi:hypothetical protein